MRYMPKEGGHSDQVLLKLYEQYLIAVRDIEASYVIAAQIYILQERGVSEEILRAFRKSAVYFVNDSIIQLENIDEQLIFGLWSPKYSPIAEKFSKYLTELTVESHVALALLEKDKLTLSDVERLADMIKLFQEYREKIYDMITGNP